MPAVHMPIKLIDSHSHFDDPRLDACREESYAEALAAGVVQQVIPAVSANTWQRVKTLCRTFTGLYPAYGLHPMFMAEHESRHLDALTDWLHKENAVAVGECGLDYFIGNPDKAAQKRIFSGQLQIAAELSLPAIIHANRAVEDVIIELKNSPLRRGVVHSYNGSRQQAERLIELGFKMSFGGAITYDRAKKLRELVKTLPLDSLLLETDAPDQPPAGHHRQLNKPAYLQEIFTAFCQLREEPADRIASRLNTNAADLFTLPAIGSS